MEGANEAARHAVNEILRRAGPSGRIVDTWPLTEPTVFEPWKRLDERLLEHGQPHLFELLGVRRAAQAADLLRRFTAFTGIDKLDDLLDQVRASQIIRSLLDRLGL